MQDTIKNVINGVHENFIEKEWCVLNTTGLTTANYTDECQQEYYLLKYYPAYLAEYYEMYSELLEMYEKESMNIISIGCGAGIDYDALNIIEDKPLFNYRGVDIIDWSYKLDFVFEQIDINQLNEQYFDDIDVIVFPKILTELSDVQIQTLANIIVNSNLSNELYFLNSYITDDSNDNSRIDGITQFKIICNKLKEHGFSIEKNSCSTYIYYKGHDGIRKHIPNFIYPNDKKDFISDLKSNCIQYDESKVECEKCNIGEYPMMNSKYMAFNVIKFVKNDN